MVFCIVRLVLFFVQLYEVCSVFSSLIKSGCETIVVIQVTLEMQLFLPIKLFCTLVIPTSVAIMCFFEFSFVHNYSCVDVSL